MSRIIYGSSAGVVATAAVVAAVLLAGSGDGIDSSTARAEGRQTSQSPAGGGQPDADSDSGVRTVHPTVEDLLRTTTQPVQVEAYESTAIYAKASGFLKHVPFDIGDRIERDQVLAELWIPEMDQELLQKTALVEQARAVVDQSQAQLTTAQALIATAEAELAETRAEIAQHEAELVYRRSEHRRIAELVRSQSVTESIEDEKRKQMHSAEAALAAAQARVRSAEVGVQVSQARQQEATAGLLLAESRLKVAEADLEQTRTIMQYARIRAPYDGLITRRWVDSGAFVASAATSKSEPLFTFDRIDRLRLVFDIPESESTMVQAGQPVSLVVDALKNRKFSGKVVRTAGVLDTRTRTLRVEAELDRLPAGLRPGMYGMITVTLADKSQTVMLPTRCIHFEDDAPYVLCYDRGVPVKRPVELGYSDRTRCEIVSGVGPDDRVLLDVPSPVGSGNSQAAVQPH